VLRDAHAPPAGLALGGQEWIAEASAEQQMAAHRAAMEDQFLEAAADGDFVGMQIYSCARIGPDGPVAPAPELMTLVNIEYRPQALGASVRRVREVLPTTPVVVTENGVATADDTQRITFIDEALRGLAAAMTDGADVRGYFHWSLLDNLEWFHGYRPTFRTDRRRSHHLRPHPQAEPGLAGPVCRSARIELISHQTFGIAFVRQAST
jgi:beta-glucosidase